MDRMVLVIRPHEYGGSVRVFDDTPVVRGALKTYAEAFNAACLSEAMDAPDFDEWMDEHAPAAGYATEQLDMEDLEALADGKE